MNNYIFTGLIILFLIYPQTVEASNEEAIRLIKEASIAIKSGDSDGVLIAFDKLHSLKIKLPNSFSYKHGLLLFNAGKYKDAYSRFYSFTSDSRTNSDNENFNKAIEYSRKTSVFIEEEEQLKVTQEEEQPIRKLPGVEEINYDGGDRYLGQRLNNKRHGKGIYYFNNGVRYIGNWNNGEQHGVGTFHYSKTERYEGQFVNGEQDGKGVMYYKKGLWYEGQFKNGVKHGKGTCHDEIAQSILGSSLSSLSFHYEGEWIDGVRHGKGILYQGTKRGFGTPSLHQDWEHGVRIDNGRHIGPTYCQSQN
jgi:hypothetical protein